MSDVFISYSRKDIAFARLLHEALQADDVETWIDWARIPVGEKWWDEICEAISQAGVFLFIISRNSVGSEVCKKEIDQALSHNKRIIPVIVDETSVAAIEEFVPDLTAINWIIFKQDDVFQIKAFPDKKLKAEEQFKALPKEPRFQKALEKLNNAIHTDWAWVKAHTRLETRALEWDRQGREASLLLRGKDLREAEERLEKAAGRKDLQPTVIQKNYILASRTAEKRRQRVLIGGIAVAVIAAAILGYLVWNRSRAASEANVIAESEAIARATAEFQAQQQQATAEAENIRAEALRLASEAEKINDSSNVDSELAILLGIQSLKRYYNAQADKALSIGMMNLGYAPKFGGHSGALYNLAVSPDGKFLLTAGSDKTTKLWEVSTGRLIHTFYGHTGTINNVDFAPDGKTFLSASSDGNIIIWDLETKKAIRVLSGQSHSVFNVAFSPDGKFIISTSPYDSISLWDVVSGSLVYDPERFSTIVENAVFSPDGKTILASTHVNLVLFDIATCLPIKDYDLEGIDHVAFSPDGKQFLTLNTDNSINLRDLETGNLIRTFQGSNHEVSSAVFSSNGEYIAATSSGLITLWKVDGENEIASISSEREIFLEVEFSPDGKFLFTSNINGLARLWDIKTSQEIRVFDTLLVNDPLLFTPDGQYMAAANIRNSLVIWNPETGEQINTITGHTGLITGFAFSPDGNFVATVSQDNMVMIHDIRVGALIHSMNGLEGVTDNVVYSPDGLMLAVSNTQKIRIWDTSTGNEIPLESMTDPKQNFILFGDIRFSADGKLLYFQNSKTLCTLEISSGKIIDSVDKENSLSLLSDVSSEGTFVKTFENDGIKLFDAATNTEIRIVDQPLGAPWKAFLSTNGKHILTVDDEKNMLILDSSSGEILRTIPQLYPILGFHFSPDGTKFVVGIMDNGTSVLLWDTDINDAMARACSQLTRDLTPEERIQYGITDDTPTCDFVSAAVSSE